MERRDYQRCIDETCTYIWHHLDGELRLPTLAARTAFSPFHFHRLFKAMVGETLNDYIRRLRLEKAAQILVFNRGISVTEVALECGFASVSAFSRAFGQQFGVSPTAFRAHRILSVDAMRSGSHRQTDDAVDLTGSGGPTPPGLEAEPPKLRNRIIQVQSLPAYHVAYVRHHEGYHKGVYSEGISRAFDKAARWMDSRRLFTKQTLCLGITYDNPDLTDGDKCRYDAAFTVPADITVADGDVGIFDLPEGRYAVCQIEVDNPTGDAFGKAIEALEWAVDHLYGVWLPDSGYEPEIRPCLEMYHTDKDAPLIHIEYCMPVKRV